MKILQIIPVFSDRFGGPVSVVRSISKQLSKKHEVTVYTTIDENLISSGRCYEEQIDGYRVVYFPKISKLSGFNISMSMAKELKNSISDYDIVHLHSWRHFQDVIVPYYASKNGVPYVLQVHGALSRNRKYLLKTFFDSTFGRVTLNRSGKLIALSAKEFMQYETAGVASDKIALIPNGVDIESFSILPEIGHFKKKLGISTDSKVILYLGRLNPSKGIDFLLESYISLEKNSPLNAVLVIAGPDDGIETKLKALSERGGVRAKVFFAGPVSREEKLSAFIDSDVVVNVEPDNVFGLVPIEGAACGKPVIVSKGNAISDLINDGSFGIAVEYGNVQDLVSALRSVLEEEKLAYTYGFNGRKYVFENLSWSVIVEKLEKTYSELIFKTPIALLSS